MLGGLLLPALATGACQGDEEEESAEPARGSPNARPELTRMFREDLATPRDPADGGGRAWLELEEGQLAAIEAGGVGRWSFVYEAGPLGIRAGGSLHFQVSPYWGWSSPQIADPRRAGYTTVESLAEGVELEAQSVGMVDPRPVMVVIRGRDLRESERIRLTYGDGEVGAVADRNAERGSTFWFAVDGDGDGVRELLAEQPGIDVLPGPPALLVATLASTARPGEPLRLTVAVLDVLANAGRAVEGRVALSSEPQGLALPEALELRAADNGRRTIELAGAPVGLWRVRAGLELDGETLDATSNPAWVGADQEQIYWGDLHGHSAFSDGTGRPEDYFRYAREVAALDFVALTDHDHFGMRAMDTHPDMWEEVRAEVRAFQDPGRFVTLLGYEWTSWIHGHRHVLYFGDQGQVHSSIDLAAETPAQLWDALRGLDAMTFAHHSAGAPIATDWSFAPDPVLEPLTEVMSVHGSSEAADCPSIVAGAIPGNFVRDVLDGGIRLGFVGSGDGHDGHPGLAHLSPVYGYRPERRVGNGGLAAVRAAALERPALLSALRARRTYATSGPRILLEAEWAGHPLGAAVPAADVAQVAPMRIRLSGTAPIEELDLVRSGLVVRRLAGEGALDLELELSILPARPGEYLYLRAIQRDGGMAWSSPWFVDA